MAARKSSRSLPAALCGLILAACQSTQGSAGSGGLPEGLPEGAFAEQPTEDRSVEADLAQVIRASRIVDGLRVVELDLRNEAPRPVAFAYGVEWLDRAGQRVVDLEAAWTPLMLAAGESRPLELRAPSPQADSWILMAATLPPQ